MAGTADAQNKLLRKTTKAADTEKNTTDKTKTKKLQPRLPKQRVITRIPKARRKAPRVKKIPGAPNTDNVLQKVPAIVSKPPVRDGIDPKNLTKGKLPSSPSLTNQQPARNTGSRAIPGRRQSGPRKRAAERFLKRGSQGSSSSQQQKFPGAKDLATNGNSKGQGIGHSKIGVGKKLSRKKPKVDGNRDDFISDGTSVSDKGCCGRGLVDFPTGFQHRRRAGRTHAKQHIHPPPKKKKGRQIGAGEGETGGENEGEGESENKKAKKKKKVAGVSQPVPGAAGVRGRAQAEKVKSQLGIKRLKNTPIDPDRNPQAFDPGPIDERFIPKKTDLAQPVPGEESRGPRVRNEKNFGSSTGVFGTGAIDPGLGGD